MIMKLCGQTNKARAYPELSPREAGWKFVNVDDVARKDPNIVLDLKN